MKFYKTDILNNSKIQFWLFVIILATLTSFMMYCYFPSHELRFGHDTYFHLQRMSALMEALKHNSYPIYIDYEAVNKYSYATRWFYPDVILIPFAVIGNLTSLIFAYKTLLFTASMASGIFIYLAVRNIYKSSFAATISALLYTFCIYRLLDLFERGALGEVLAFVFIPLVFWGLQEVINRNYKKWYLITIGYTLLIFSHLLSSVLTLIIIIIILLFYFNRILEDRKIIYYLLLSAFVTFILTTYYWLPMLEQMKSNEFYYELQNISFTKRHGIPFRMFVKGLISGLMPPGSTFSVGIGIMLTVSICLRFFVKEKSEKLKSIDKGVIIGLLLLISCSRLFPWWIEPFNKLSFIQVPWRFFIFISYFFALAGGYYTSVILKKRRSKIICVCITVIATGLIILSESNGYKSKNRTITPTSIAPTIKLNYHMGGLEYIPLKVPSMQFIEDRGSNVLTENEETIISNFEKNKGLTSFGIKTNGNETLELPLFYYKGYAAKLDNKNISVNQSKNGLVELNINQSGTLKVFYAGTFIQKLSYYISILSILILCFYIYKYN